MRKKKDASIVMDVFLDSSTYDKFRAFLAKNRLDESDALTSVLERGMVNYWLQLFKQLKQNYQFLEKLFEEYKKDNEMLKALKQQNEKLRKILEEKKEQSKLQLSR